MATTYTNAQVRVALADITETSITYNDQPPLSYDPWEMISLLVTTYPDRPWSFYRRYWYLALNSPLDGTVADIIGVTNFAEATPDLIRQLQDPVNLPIRDVTPIHDVNVIIHQYVLQDIYRHPLNLAKYGAYITASRYIYDHFTTRVYDRNTVRAFGPLNYAVFIYRLYRLVYDPEYTTMTARLHGSAFQLQKTYQPEWRHQPVVIHLDDITLYRHYDYLYRAFEHVHRYHLGTQVGFCFGIERIVFALTGFFFISRFDFTWTIILWRSWGNQIYGLRKNTFASNKNRFRSVRRWFFSFQISRTTIWK